MTAFAVSFHTANNWILAEIEATDADAALAHARDMGPDDILALDFDRYDAFLDVEGIQLLDAECQLAAEWIDPTYRVRLAATDMMTALAEAFAALRSIPPFAVPSLDSDSSIIAAKCEAALTRALEGEE